MLRKQRQKAPAFLPCRMKTEGRKRCGETMELVDGDTSGKYWLYYCPVHGGISVLKGSRLK